MSERDEALRTYEPYDDSGAFDILSGKYEAAITAATYDEERDCYQLEFTIVNVINGNGAPGRKLWKKYYDLEGIKRLVNDLWKSEIEVNRETEKQFQADLPKLINKEVLLRGSEFTPTKKMDGTPIPEEDQAPVQATRVLAKKTRRGKSTSKVKVPF